MKIISIIISAILLTLIMVMSTQAGQADNKIDAAVIAYKNGDYAQATNLFKQALALDKENALAWYFYGQSLEKISDWKEAVNAYEQVMRIEPEGKVAAKAKARLDSISILPEVVAIKKEQEAWESASQSGSEKGYQNYLNIYPQGNHAGLAQARIEKLQSDRAAARQKHEEELKRQRDESPTKGYVTQGGLIWMPVTFRKTWNEANSYCANTTINGQTGWRLPTKDELEALYKSGAMNGQGWEMFDIWSSTPFLSKYDFSSSHYLFFMLKNGSSIAVTDTMNCLVTCVR